MKCKDCKRILTEEEISHANDSIAGKYMLPHKDLCCDCHDETFMKGDDPEDIERRRTIPRQLGKDPEKMIEWLERQIKWHNHMQMLFKNHLKCYKNSNK